MGKRLFQGLKQPMTASAQTVYFVTHPEVLIDPAVPVTDWQLSPRGRKRLASMLLLPWVSGVRAVWRSSERAQGTRWRGDSGRAPPPARQGVG